MREKLSLPRLFADTSSIPEIERLKELGLIHGITTNPILVAKESNTGNPFGHYEELAKSFPDMPISIQLLDEDVPTLIQRAKSFAAISPNIVVKVPMFGDGRGLSVLYQLTREGIKTNVTGLMKAEQLLLALLVGRGQGPAYVSLFFNRIRDGGGNPTEEITRSRHLIEAFNFNSEIITGSIRGQKDVYEATIAGTHIVTVTPSVIWEMIHHHKSVEFIEQSQRDWEKLTQKL